MLRAQIMFHVHLDIFIRLSASSSSICYPFYVCLVSRKPNNSMSILNLVDLSVFIQTTYFQLERRTETNIIYINCWAMIGSRSSHNQPENRNINTSSGELNALFLRY